MEARKEGSSPDLQNEGKVLGGIVCYGERRRI
jgi:hypothetical protein